MGARLFLCKQESGERWPGNRAPRPVHATPIHRGCAQRDYSMRSCTKVLETPPKRLVLTLILTLALALVAVAGMPQGAGADPALDGEEQAVPALINNYRTQNGLGTFSLNTQLTNASDWMSNDMAVNNYFSQTHSLGP